MELHRTSGRWKLGLALSLCTVLLWGMLPIALKALLRGLDALTISWFRFLLACLLLVAWYARSGELVRLLRAPGKGRLLLLVAA
ncbi:MAG: EamA family transporter, partial [Candidatus Cloacimonetes bacterium]|nr:EamA family transporter [Candidatus Cloacimonadota bacterium]